MKKKLAQGAEIQKPSSSPGQKKNVTFVDVKAKFRLPVFTFSEN